MSRMHSPHEPILGSHVPTACTFCDEPWPCQGHRMEQADTLNGPDGYARAYNDGYQDGAAGKFYDPGINRPALRLDIVTLGAAYKAARHRAGDFDALDELRQGLMIREEYERLADQ